MKFNSNSLLTYNRIDLGLLLHSLALRDGLPPAAAGNRKKLQLSSAAEPLVFVSP